MPGGTFFLKYPSPAALPACPDRPDPSGAGEHTGPAAAFLAGYFRIVFYILEAPLAWILGTLASGRDAPGLWKLNPVNWDELIWMPLPRLDRHLLALQQQNGTAAQNAVSHVRRSFHQRWAAERILKQGMAQE